MWHEEKKTKNGELRYKYCEQVKSPYSGKLIRVSVTMLNNSTQTEKTASRLLLARLDEAIEKEKTKTIEANTKYFHDVANEWQEFKALSVKLATIKNDKISLSKLFGVVAPDTPVDKVSPIEIEKLLHTLYYSQGLSWSYVNKVLTTFKQVMKYARRKKYIDDIREYEEIELKKKPISPDDVAKNNDKFLERDELEAVLLALSQYPRLQLLCEFMVHTGLRIGEALALRERDYSKEKRYVHVNGSISHHYKNGESLKRGTPKNVYSIRYVSLDDRSIDILESIIRENRRLMWNSKYKNSDGYIFVTDKGSPYNHQYIRFNPDFVKLFYSSVDSFLNTLISAVGIKSIEFVYLA